MKKIFLGLGFSLFALALVLGVGARSVSAAAPLLTAIAHDETAKTITITYNQAVHYETEWGNVVTPVSPAILNIFEATWNAGTSSWDYDLDHLAPDATITATSFNGANTILTITYSGTLKQTAYTHYLVDSWVADSAPGADDGGYDLKNAGGQALADGGTAISAFTVIGNDTSSPELTAVIHNEKADTKSITLVFSEPVEFTTEWGDLLVAAGDIPDVLNIFKSNAGNYSLSDVETGATITDATFDTGTEAGTILTITYSGALTPGQTYVVDSWTVAGGWDIKDVAGNVDVEGVNPVFTAGNGTDEGGPALTAVAHDEVAKTITLTYDKPFHFETEHGNIVTAVTPEMLNIFATTLNTGSGLYEDYELSDVAPNVTIKTTTFNDDSTVLTIHYVGTLVNDKHYVVDSWSYDIKDLAGNTDIDGVSPIFVASIPHGGGGGGGGSASTHPTTPAPGCSAGNLFNTSTGQPCGSTLMAPGCSAGNSFNTITGVSCGNGGNSPTVNPPTTPPAGNAYAFGNTLVREGTRGEACRAWQMFLNDKTGAHLVTDGICGPLTIAAARAWQTSALLEADGILGPMSRAKANMQ